MKFIICAQTNSHILAGSIPWTQNHSCKDAFTLRWRYHHFTVCTVWVAQEKREVQFDSHWSIPSQWKILLFLPMHWVKPNHRLGSPRKPRTCVKWWFCAAFGAVWMWLNSFSWQTVQHRLRVLYSEQCGRRDRVPQWATRFVPEKGGGGSQWEISTAVWTMETAGDGCHSTQRAWETRLRAAGEKETGIVIETLRITVSSSHPLCEPLRVFIIFPCWNAAVTITYIL